MGTRAATPRRGAQPARMGKIAVAIAGVGNCASSLLQRIEFYRSADHQTPGACIGLMHYDLCGYRPSDLEVVCAFDVDRRKVGQPLHVAAFALPNNTRAIHPKLRASDVRVEMGPVLGHGVSRAGRRPSATTTQPHHRHLAPRRLPARAQNG